MDLGEVGEERESGLVAKRGVDETVVGEGAHRSDSSGLLATTEGTGGDEETSILAVETTGCPDTTSAVPEGLPLGRKVTVTGGDTEENGIVLEELVGLLKDGHRGLGGSVHLGEDIFGQGLLNPVRLIVSWVVLIVSPFVRGISYWKMSAVPPAAWIPLSSAWASFSTWP
jgi:hypothetical protein